MNMRKFFSCCSYVSICILGAFLLLPTFLPTSNNEIDIEKYDAIIVLGAGLKGNCTLDASLMARMEKAIELYRQKKASRIIVTGGIQPQNNTCVEAVAMRRFAITKNIPRKAIISEKLARNTYENAFYTTKLMGKEKMKSALIVTSDFHSKRVDFIFGQYPIKQKIVPAPSKTIGYQKYKELGKEQLLLCFHTLFGIPDNFGINLSDQNFTTVLKHLAQN